MNSDFHYPNQFTQESTNLSDQEQFIGRGERLVKQLLENPFGVRQVTSQVPIGRLISFEDFQFFDDEIKKHKFDFVIYRNNGEIIAVEVNYKHGAKADSKSNNIFEPVLKKNGVSLLTIDDHSCRTLFNLNSKGVHKLLNTVAQKEGFTPNTDVYTNQELIDRKIN